MEVDPEVKENLQSRETWIRGLFILLFALVSLVTRFVILGVVVLQFLFVLFNGQLNPRLDEFGRGLAWYIRDIVLYVTQASDVKPFPFGDWPKE